MHKKQRKTLIPFELKSYPVGTFIQTEKGSFYVVSEERRLPITTQRCLDSWKVNTVVETSESNAAVKKLSIGLPLKFRNGSLLYSHATGRLYLISQGKLRHVTNFDVLQSIGLNYSDAVWVSLDEINLHEKGEPLNG